MAENQKNKFQRSQDKTLLDEIKNSYKEGNLLPFIGAGFPKNIDDFPDWDRFVNEDLANDLIEQCNIKLPKHQTLSKLFGDNIRATEYYVYRIGLEIAKKEKADPNMDRILYKGKDQLGTKLSSKFNNIKYNSTDKEKWKVYEKFISLKNFSTIYTSNWDQTLEESCKILMAGDKYYTVINEDKLREYLSQRKKRLIIKYHGDYQLPQTLIATESDYFRRLTSRNILDIKLQHDLSHYDFLFLGFSFNDIFIRYILYQINYMLKDVLNVNCPRILLVSIGKPIELLADYYKVNRIETFDICQVNNCHHIGVVSKEKCEKYLKKGNCSIRDYFVNLFETLKEVE